MKRGVFVGFLFLALITACVPRFAPPPGCEDVSPSASENPPAITGSATVDLPVNITKPETKKQSSDTPVKQVKEGELISFPNLKATDPDGDKLTYTFTPPLDQNGRWQTKQGDAGEYKVTITADDGKNKVSQSVIIIVEASNRPPVITVKDELKVKEGDAVTLQPVITDPDGDDITITYSGWMDTNTKQTGFKDAGRHKVTISATDGALSAAKAVIVVVDDINRPPMLEQINDILIKEGDKITLRPTASDPDGDRVTFKYSKPFDSFGVWQTKKGDTGSYRVNVSATDGKEEVTIRFFVAVESINQPPKLEFAETVISVNEGEIITLYPQVSDLENDAVRITYSGWMKENSYKTDHDDAGVHTVLVTATDSKNKVEKTITINVRDINRPPVFGAGSFE